jgi:hypothetical protein
MRQELKFGGTTARGGNPHPCASSISSPSLTSSASSEPRVSFPLFTNHQSPITAFLIDTPAIRNALKSFNCSRNVHSNRHSSGHLRLHQTWADSLGAGCRCTLALIGEGSPAMQVRRDSAGRCYNANSALRSEAKLPGRTASHGAGIRKMRIRTTDFASITSGKRNVA